MIELPWHAERLLLTGDFPGFTANELYDHWSKSDLLATFWAPKSVIDLRPGGYYRLEWPETDAYLHGHFLRVERGIRLSFDWTWNHELGKWAPLVVDMFFKNIEGGSQLTVEHWGFTPSDLHAIPSTAEGWIHFGNRLRALRDPT